MASPTSSRSSIDPPLSPTLEAKFRDFERSVEFIDLRLECLSSLDAQNDKMVERFGFRIEDVKAFRNWQLQQQKLREEEKRYRRRYWPAEDIALMLDTLSNSTTPEQLEEMRLNFDNRARPKILLGRCNGHNLRLVINAFRLAQTYQSLEVRDNDDPNETCKAGDGREQVPLLLSLYRNMEDGDEADTSDRFTQTDPNDTSAEILVKIIANELERIHRLRQAQFDLGVNPDDWKFIANEGRNRLKTFLPLGRLQVQEPFREGWHPDYWADTQWYLVVNTYDKRPWIVLNPDMPSPWGAENLYLSPGQRMDTFCGGKSLLSHARLDFSTVTRGRMDNAKEYRQGKEREARPLPGDFWRKLFSSNGTLDRIIEAAPFFQDNRFCLGAAVWDGQDKRIYRRFDTDKSGSDAMIDDYIFARYRERAPPRPMYTRVEASDYNNMKHDPRPPPPYTYSVQ